MGRIVVGVDGSEQCGAALEWALAEAALRGATLEAVCAYRLPSGWLGMGEAMGATMPVSLTESDVEVYAKDALDRMLDAAGGHGSVEVVRRAVAGHAAQVLVEASDGADLLVVGSRGHGDVGSLLLGSTGMHCVHHAGCPVVVVRGGPAGR
jgi:nucleotide-binding universal stress UspA family protein